MFKIKLFNNLFFMLNINESEKELELIDYLFGNNLLSANEYRIAKFVQKAFRKQKVTKTSCLFRLDKVKGCVLKDRVQGGKNDRDDFINMIINNEDWTIIENIMLADTIFFEQYIGKECIIADFIKNSNAEKIVLKLIQLIDILTYNLRNIKKIKLNLTDKIFITKSLVQRDTLTKVSNETGLTRKTIHKILFDNENNYTFKNLIKLLSYYDLDKNL